MNAVISVACLACQQVKDAINGLVALTPALSSVIDALSRAAVPPAWASVAGTADVPELSISQWLLLLTQQCEQLRNWIDRGQPSVFWLPGFVYPKVRARYDS